MDNLSQEIGRIQPHALYILVVNNNRYNIKNIWFNKISKTDKDLSTNNSSSAANLSTSLSSNEESEYNIIDIIFSKNEFDSLIQTKQYSRTEKNKSKLAFDYTKYYNQGNGKMLLQENYGKYVSCNVDTNLKETIFNNTLTICGKCNCGSIINGIAENITDSEFVIIKCT